MAVTLNDKYLKGVVNADELKGMEPIDVYKRQAVGIFGTFITDIKKQE